MANMYNFKNFDEQIQENFDAIVKEARKQRDIEEVYYELGLKALLGAIPMALTGDIIIGGAIWTIVLNKARKKAFKKLDEIEAKYDETENDNNE